MSLREHSSPEAPSVEEKFHQEIAALASCIESVDPSSLECLDGFFVRMRDAIDRLICGEPLSLKDCLEFEAMLADQSVWWLENLFAIFEDLKHLYEPPKEKRGDLPVLGVTVNLQQAVDKTHRTISDEFALADAVLKEAIPREVISLWESENRPKYHQVLAIVALYRYMQEIQRSRGEVEQAVAL